jgi:hypothetical protein
MNPNHLRILRQLHVTAAACPRTVSDLVRIVGIVLCIFFASTTTTSAIQLTSDKNGTKCIDLRMILVFEDRPIDVTINLHTVSTIDTNNEPQQYYWENYVPYSRTNVSTTSLLEEICIPRNECYILQVVDNAKIGWDANAAPTITPTNSTRAFSISFDQHVIGIYDSRVVNSCFAVQWYQFGYSCRDDTTEDSATIDNSTESTMISIYRGSLPCPTSNEANTGNSNGTGTPNISDADETILKGNNITVSFSGTDISGEPTIAPTQELDLQRSDSPSVSSAPSKIPSMMPSISRLPSSIPTNIAMSSNSPIVADSQPATTITPHFDSDMPSILLLSSIGPSDVPSNFPSMVPTVECVKFFMIVRLDEHPEDMILTLTSTNEPGSEDDVVIWDRIRPWNSGEGKNVTYDQQQFVNQTTCIHTDECYTFVVEDIAQDGLTSTAQEPSTNVTNGNEAAFPTLGGYFTLSYDTDRIISYYDGNVDGCYHKKIYNFGLSSNCVMTETTEPMDRSCPQVRRRR